MQVEAVACDGIARERCRELGETIAVVGVVLEVLDGAALGGQLGEPLGEGTVGRIVRGVVVVVRVA